MTIRYVYNIVSSLLSIGESNRLNNYSIATDKLSESLQRSAGTLKVMGNDLSKAAALTVAGNSILQDPDSVAAGLRTISLRLAGTKVAAEKLKKISGSTGDLDGLETELEGMTLTTSKLNAQIQALTSVNGGKGVSILDENGAYRDTYDILLDIAKVYKDIQEADSKFGTKNAQAILEIIAGKNRSNVLASILQNPELLENVYKTAQNSSGSALEELKKYKEGVEGTINELQNTWEEAWTNTLSSGFIKWGVNAAETFLNVTSAASGLVPVIANLIALFLRLKYEGKTNRFCPIRV